MSEALNVIKATFGGLRQATTAYLYQWDYGQILQIEGLALPQAFEVHFGNSRERGTTTTSIGTDGQVVIPDECLASGADIFAFIFLHEDTQDGETEYVIRIPVKPRPQPTDVEPTPQEQSAITQAIAALNSAVTQTGEDVASADASAQAAQGYASQAYGASGQAQIYAQRAADSATAAAGSASAAQAAKTAAETASGNASTAYSDTQRYAAEIEVSLATMQEMMRGAVQDARMARDGAQEAQQAIEDMTVSSTTLPAGSQATVAKTESGGVVNLAFGLPQGAKGDKGNKGDKGDTGAQGDSYILTSADKTEIAQIVLAEFPVWEGGEY